MLTFNPRVTAVTAYRTVAASGLDFTVAAAAVRTVSAPFLVATSFGVSME